MRKFLGSFAVVGLASLSFVGAVPAMSNLPDATDITLTGTDLTLGPLLTCSTADWSATTFDQFTGIHVSINAANTTGTTGCIPNGASTKSTGPKWTLDLSRTTNGGATWEGPLTGVVLDVHITAGVDCTYSGGASAVYTNATMLLAIGGSMTRTAGSVFCSGIVSLSGIFHVSPTLTIS